MAWVLLIIVGLLLAGEVIRGALLQRLPDAAALAIDPRSASALTRAAESELTAGHGAAAQALARRALSAEPFNAAALRDIGLFTASQSGPDSADQIMTLAGDWSLRDGPTQAWLFEQRLRHRDYASAFAHGDALIRQVDEARAPLFKTLAALMKEDPHALAPLAQRLSTDPPWRSAFLDSLNSDPQSQATAATLMMGFSNSGHPATIAELSDLLNSLVQAGHYRDADVLWRRLSVGGKSRGQPYDGDFTAPESPQPFSWIILGGEGSNTELAADGDSPNKRALEVQYDGYATPDLIKTLMVLQPGPHRLSGAMRSETAAGADRLGWVIKCADDGQVLVEVKGAPALAPGSWQPFFASFSVPASACQGQWLQLVAYPGERRTDITVWYDHLAVTP